MLILSRLHGESIVIAHNIKITVLTIDRHSVRLGIDAPKTTQIDREEIYREKYGNSPAGTPPVADTERRGA